MNNDIFSKYKHRGQNVGADRRRLPPTVQNYKIEGLPKSEMRDFAAKCICLDNVSSTGGAGSRNGKLV